MQARNEFFDTFSVAPVSPTYYRIKNRWTGDVLHIEGLKGSAQ